MKKLLLIFLAFFYLMGMVSASVEVHDYNFKTVYYPYERISGEINLTISHEDYATRLYSGKVKKSF